MKVIVATWLDITCQPYLSEIFDSDLFESEILDYYKEAKSMYGHNVIAESTDALVFSDGTRVTLTMQHVKNSAYDDEVTRGKFQEYLRIAE